jgi:hypothetical protein
MHFCCGSMIRLREKEIRGTEYFQTDVACDLYKLNHSFVVYIQIGTFSSLLCI